MWNLALGTYLFLWFKETIEQRGGCVCVGRGSCWLAREEGRLRLECGECGPLGTEVWWAAEHVLSTGELSPTSVGLRLVSYFCVGDMHELQ